MEVTSPGTCPRTGNRCFYTLWREASEAGKGRYEPEQIDNILTKGLAIPEVAKELVCSDKSFVDLDEGEEPRCAAFGLLMSFAILEITENRDNQSFLPAEVSQTMEDLSGFATE